MSGLDIHYDLGEGHPLLGRRMPDLDLVTEKGPLRVFTLLHDAQPVLLNFGEPGGLDVTPWADRLQRIDARLETALEARRQRILTSHSQVSPLKWLCVFVQAVCVLFVTALIHSDDRLAAAITMGVFATGVAASVLLIAAYDRPFVGELAVGPQPLLQVIPAPID